MEIRVVPYQDGTYADSYKDPSQFAVLATQYPRYTILDAPEVRYENNQVWYRTVHGDWLMGRDVAIEVNLEPIALMPEKYMRPAAATAPAKAPTKASDKPYVKGSSVVDKNNPIDAYQLNQEKLLIANKIDKVDALLKNNFTNYSEQSFYTSYRNSMSYLKSMTDEKSEKARQRMPMIKFKYIQGAPFQFIDNTDPRQQSGDSYGRVYADKIISNAPIVTFTPGAPRFNSSWTIGNAKEDKLLFALKKSDKADGELEKELKKMLGGLGLYDEGAQYYYFHPMFSTYVRYVNTMIRTSAHFAGIGDRNIYIDTGKSVKASAYNFRNVAQDPANSPRMRNLLGFDEAVAFYFEPGNGVSESLGNTTSESALSGLNKGISDKAREAEQLLGAGAGMAIDSMDDSNVEQMIFNMNDVKDYNPNSPLGRLKTNAKISMLGANMRLPEIWRDSNYVKSYSIDMKFVSPYGTPFSKWLHCLVPFFALICLGAPIANTANSYQSPFILRAYSKGYFNCEMAMIDSISIKKFGDGDGVTEDGMPSEIEVSVSFKDLYTALTMTSIELNPKQFLHNSGLIEFIGTTTGLNMNKSGGGAYISLAGTTAMNVLRDTPGNFMFSTRDSLVKGLMNMPVVGGFLEAIKFTQ